MKEEYKFIIKSPKSQQILLNLFRKPNYLSKISKEENITLGYALNILKKMENLIEREKEGRKKLISLNDRGKGIAKKLNELYWVLNEN